MKIKTNKDFDCVNYVRKERKRITMETEDKTPEDIMKYFKKRKKNTGKIKINNV